MPLNPLKDVRPLLDFRIWIESVQVPFRGLRGIP